MIASDISYAPKTMPRPYQKQNHNDARVIEPIVAKN